MQLEKSGRTATTPLMSLPAGPLYDTITERVPTVVSLPLAAPRYSNGSENQIARGFRN
jgi:hypothetical protein